jgi:hypothetical protein
MIKSAIMRNLALTIAMGLLLFAEFLHPVFHNHDTCSKQETQYFVDGAPCLVQGDFELEHTEDACPICSSMFLKYCANNSTFIGLCNYLNYAILLPLNFIFVETHFTGSPRAPPALS